MLKYTCSKRFFCGALGRPIPEGAICCRYENVTKLTILDAPDSYDENEVDDFEYTDPKKVVWFDDQDVRSIFFTFDGKFPEDDYGGGIDYEEMRYRGKINNPTDFPSLNTRRIGDTHYINNNVTDPATAESFSTGQTIYWAGSQYYMMGGGGGGGAGASYFTEMFTLSSTDISNGYITLSNEISDETKVLLFVQGAPTQTYNYDYSVNPTTKQVIWAGNGLDGLLQEGDKLTIVF